MARSLGTGGGVPDLVDHAERALDAPPAASMGIDVHGCVTSAAQLEEVLGWHHEEVLGWPVTGVNRRRSGAAGDRQVVPRTKGVHRMSNSTTTLNLPARTNQTDITAQPRSQVQNSLVVVDLPSLAPLMYALMFRNIASDGFT